MRGRADGERAQELVTEIRDGDSAFPVLVGGAAAEFVDQQEAIGSRLPLAAALLVLLTFSILWLMTGSVVLPLKAIVMNALTVGSALGILTFIYQDGRLESLLGYTSNGGIEPTDFLVAAALVFALSTDYGVFLLGRIKEARASGYSEREAVAVGLEHTGAVVTAAAILLAVAIGVFSTSSISFIQQVGIATAFGVLIDAFVVRTLLVPSLMALLGKWNWWSPPPLRPATRPHRLERGARAGPTGQPVLFPVLVQIQCDRVDAVALAVGTGPVREDVAQVAPAARAGDLGPGHEERLVLVQLHGAGHRGLGEAGPAGTRVELGVRAEQLIAAGPAAVHPVGLGVRVGAGEGRLSALLAQDVKALGRQLLAPLLIGLIKLGHWMNLLPKAYRPASPAHSSYGAKKARTSSSVALRPRPAARPTNLR